jgi:hypothetical protein
MSLSEEPLGVCPGAGQGEDVTSVKSASENEMDEGKSVLEFMQPSERRRECYRSGHGVKDFVAG